MGKRDGGEEMWNGLVPEPCVLDIKWRDILGARDPSPTPDHKAQGSSARKITSGCKNQWGLDQQKKV